MEDLLAFRITALSESKENHAFFFVFPMHQNVNYLFGILVLIT
jgi:hypothetical protein